MAESRCIAMKVVWILLFSWLYLGLSCCYGQNIERCPSHLPKNRYLRIHGDMCYRFVTSEVSWTSARDSCIRTGGTLITITSRDIQLFVERSLQELWRRNGMWLGAHDRGSEMEWYWVTGQRVRSTYQNWDRGQPSCFLPNFLCHEDCGVLRTDEGYQWHDYLCNSDLYTYGYACQYGALPEPTEPAKPVYRLTTPPPPPPPTTTKSTTTTSTTTASTTTSTTTASTTTSTTTASTTTKATTQKTPLPQTEGASTITTKSVVFDQESTNVSLLMKTPDNMIQVESQMLSSEESGMKTGGMVGLIVSFVLVFFAGIIIGIFLCRRRYRKRYDESMSVGFNNVLYTAAPRTEVSTKVKDTNILAAATDGDMTDEEVDHRKEIKERSFNEKYVDIDEIIKGKANNVELPPLACKDVDSAPNDACLKENVYETVKSHCEEGESDVEEGGACGEEPPPPCPGVHVKQFAPEFLMKDTDVSQAYSNNLYGYTK